MSGRWQYRVVEVPVKLMTNDAAERAHAELDKLGAQGWELVSVVHSPATYALSMFMKRRH